MMLAAATAQGESFLHDLAIVMIVAGLVTIVFHRLKQPVVLGYILAGVNIGSHTPPFPLIANEQTIQTLSELGIIFLMFPRARVQPAQAQRSRRDGLHRRDPGDSRHALPRVLARSDFPVE
jgi:hypothetical protein